MKRLRPIDVETCCICGEKFDKLKMREVFTGRKLYICPGCWTAGQNEANAAKASWRRTPTGKATLEKQNKRGKKR